LTSPYDDSPFSEFLETPAIHDSNDMLTSPMIDFGADFPESFDLASASLFGGVDAYDYGSPAPPVSKPLPSAAAPELFTISPETPNLDPSSLYPSPRIPSVRRKSTATGTRKNVTPSSLVPLDAPTQPRKYTTPSSTSRKEVPAVFARKRKAAVIEEEDELLEELGPNASEKEQIEWKRRQNTIAARKSRKRKLEHQQHLEDTIESQKQEIEKWKAKYHMLAGFARSHGMNVPDDVDA
jgi:hypothetical protein